MDMPTIDHPTNRPNFTIVQVGPIRFAFSYRTVVGFHDWRNAQRGWRVSVNYWSVTTGRHLNELDNGDKSGRLDSEDFELELGRALADLDSEVS